MAHRIEALERLPQPHRRGLVLAGGWYSPSELQPKDLVTPPPELIEVLTRHTIYAVTKELLEQWERMSYTDSARQEAAQEFWAWVQQHAAYFEDAAVGGTWTAGAIGLCCASHLHPLLNDVEWHLLQLKRKGLLFHPSTESPEQGWEDFRRFVDHYRRLPRDFRKRFGPCLVLFRPASK